MALDSDLILLDVNMPDMDGLSVCRKIRSGVRCPIIFLSARAEEQDRITGLMLGGDDYIVKPFSMEELGARVMAHFRREERVRHAGSRKEGGGSDNLLSGADSNVRFSQAVADPDRI